MPWWMWTSSETGVAVGRLPGVRALLTGVGAPWSAAGNAPSPDAARSASSNSQGGIPPVGVSAGAACRGKGVRRLGGALRGDAERGAAVGASATVTSKAASSTGGASDTSVAAGAALQQARTTPGNCAAAFSALSRAQGTTSDKSTAAHKLCAMNPVRRVTKAALSACSICVAVNVGCAFNTCALATAMAGSTPRFASVCHAPHCQPRAHCHANSNRCPRGSCWP